ncbi:hypothetical protein GWO43_04725 [candidate division KSB1 bacterium]|nr:hypothetical protein [candidate division KSB1 bacterium]NIR70073.1 hypothetical protein [candidate division KSB1 bacterium]NIS23323.1 hypothetical protein [candidate division KSB1 bacterium]NIT70202.1 hypothetical protein [candidate division KSB1 bacterium]NIU23854.1 hypothetical protein [candidate division KSB1 bacterium]
MKSKSKASATVLLIAVWTGSLLGQGLDLPGGRGLLHLSSAWNLGKGSLTVHGYSSTFFKNGRSFTTGESQTFRNLQGAMTFHFASGKHFEWIVTQIVYQDNVNAANDEINLPDDLLLKLKVGSLGSNTGRFRFGFTVGTRIPLGDEDNLILEPYSTNNLEAGLTTQMTYSPDPLIPESAFNLHVNLGFWYHNDTGDFLAGGGPEDNIFVETPSTRFLYGIGMAFPMQRFDALLELTGQAFLNKPPVTAYGREDFIYLSPGMRYRLSDWVSFLAGFDFRLSNFKDTTLYQRDGTALSRVSENLTSYPFWRFRFGVQFNIGKPAPHLFSSFNGAKVGSNGEDRKKNIEIMKRLEMRHDQIKERLKTESAEEELAQIRQERERIQQLIDRLQKILDMQFEEEKEVKSESQENSDKKP